MDDVSFFSMEMKVSGSPVFDTKLLHGLVDWIPVGAMLVNNKGNILHANSELENTLGYAANELTQKNIDHLIPDEFRSKHQSYMKQFFDAPQKRQMGKGRKLYALHQNGRQIPIEIGLNPAKVEKKLLTLATLIDISPRLQADRILKQSVSSAPHGVLIVDLNGIIQLANHSVCNSFGYSENELLGQPIEMLLPERYREHHKHLIKSFNQSPIVRSMGVGRDLTALHHDGREFPVEIGLSPIKDSNNNHLIQVSLFDITQRKRMEMSLRETNTNLEEFTYVASHDLRSPLRGIADLLEWIKEDLELKSTPEIDKNLNRIQLRIRRMEQLIDNLLSYARAGRTDIEPESIDIKDLIDDITALIEIPDAFNIELNIEMDTLNATRTPLETVLRNILSNAIKHHDKESGIINICCRAENNFCYFSISDDGPGIPEPASERIFRLFQTTTSAERSGTGIGLSVSRRLTETHGGRISTTTNTPRRGVTFHLWWPRFIRTDTHD